MIAEGEKGGWRKLPVKPAVLAELNRMEMERQMELRKAAKNDEKPRPRGDCAMIGDNGSRGGNRKRNQR